MRVVPLALAWRGEPLLEAARISAMVTHAHPNTLETAMAGAWLVSQSLDGPWNRVAEGLRAALTWTERQENWLDERMIPPGDGVWRSGSALV
jgi:ADP-ribosylglycohydrolase